MIGMHELPWWRRIAAASSVERNSSFSFGLFFLEKNRGRLLFQFNLDFYLSDLLFLLLHGWMSVSILRDRISVFFFSLARRMFQLTLSSSIIWCELLWPTCVIGWFHCEGQTKQRTQHTHTQDDMLICLAYLVLFFSRRCVFVRCFDLFFLNRKNSSVGFCFTLPSRLVFSPYETENKRETFGRRSDATFFGDDRHPSTIRDDDRVTVTELRLSALLLAL